MENKIKTYRARSFKHKSLIKLKKERGVTFYLCFPALSTENPKNLVNELEIASEAKKDGLIDEFILIYSPAFDEKEKEEMAMDFYIKKINQLNGVFLNTEKIKVPDMNDRAKGEKGKGADMRRAAYHIITKLLPHKTALKKIVIGYLDGDITTNSFGEHYIWGLLGPFLDDEKTEITKLVYRRAKGFGRVNKLLGQPLLSLFNHPKMNCLRSLPYIFSGEAAFRGDFISNICFCQKYGIEMYVLLQAVLDKRFGPSKINLSNVGYFDHKHHSLGDLRNMVFGILRAYLISLEKYGALKLNSKTNIDLSDKIEFTEVQLDNKVKYFSSDFEEKYYNPLKDIIKRQ